MEVAALIIQRAISLRLRAVGSRPHILIPCDGGCLTLGCPLAPHDHLTSLATGLLQGDDLLQPRCDPYSNRDSWGPVPGPE